ncbi:MAG TPA: hypothetical protein VGF19_07720, partial [Candidatus Acidoferrum sp.]
MRSSLRFVLFVLILTIGATAAQAQWIPLNPVKEAATQPDGLLLTLESGYLRFQVNGDSIVHVVYSIEKEPVHHEDFLITKKSWPNADFTVHAEDPKTVTLSTSLLKIE